jgi:hypothetical protein
MMENPLSFIVSYFHMYHSIFLCYNKVCEAGYIERKEGCLELSGVSLFL